MDTEISEIKLTIPIPPSVNACYSTNFKTGRRFKSKEYEVWERDTALIIRKFKGKFDTNSLLVVNYDFYFPIYNKNGTIKKKDVGNYEKPLSDFLCVMFGIRDENFKKIVLEKHDSDRNEVDVEIKKVK